MTDTAIPGPLVNSAIQKPAVSWLRVVCRNSLFQLQKFNNYTVFLKYFINFSSVTQLCPTLRPHELQHARLSCPSPTPGACLNSLSIESMMLFNCLIFCRPLLLLPSIFPSSRVFPMSQFSSGGQSIGASASPLVLPMNIQD